RFRQRSLLQVYGEYTATEQDSLSVEPRQRVARIRQRIRAVRQLLQRRSASSDVEGAAQSERSERLDGHTVAHRDDDQEDEKERHALLLSARSAARRRVESGLSRRNDQKLSSDARLQRQERQ